MDTAYNKHYALRSGDEYCVYYGIQYSRGVDSRYLKDYAVFMLMDIAYTKHYAVFLLADTTYTKHNIVFSGGAYWVYIIEYAVISWFGYYVY